MTPLPVLIAALAASMAPCSPPLGGRPHYVIPGALRDVTYHDQLTLDAYAPAGEPRPAAIITHGREGTKITHVTQLFEVLDRAGFAWFSVDYHSSEDVAEAIRYVRCPGRFNITPEIVLIGEDTGAGIALSLAAHGGFRGVVTFGTKMRSEEHTSELQSLTNVVCRLLREKKNKSNAELQLRTAGTARNRR